MSGKRRTASICGGPYELRDPNPGCPNAAEHQHSPDGYIAWHDWAEEMAKTHDQHECPGCGLWLIVTPKEAAS